mmetsp:Transcript_8530/g.34441  ORF Transcript_8530/g.34441 Transcript_8530/m.34441 type:complete len:398 (+) Transcript_8530:1416-2609(+)
MSLILITRSSVEIPGHGHLPLLVPFHVVHATRPHTLQLLLQHHLRQIGPHLPADGPREVRHRDEVHGEAEQQPTPPWPRREHHVHLVDVPVARTVLQDHGGVEHARGQERRRPGHGLAQAAQDVGDDLGKDRVAYPFRVHDVEAHRRRPRGPPARRHQPRQRLLRLHRDVHGHLRHRREPLGRRQRPPRHFRENLILDPGLPLPRPEVEEAVALHHRRGVDVHPREHLLYRRHLDALAPGGVLPSVVGALRLAVHQLAQAQWARPVRAFVLYASRVGVGVAEHDPRDVEEVERDHGGLVQPRGECDGEPVRALGVGAREELLLHLRGWHRRDEELAVFNGASPRRVRIRSRGGSPRRGSIPIGGGRSLRRRPGALPGCASRAGGLRDIRPPLLVVTA